MATEFDGAVASADLALFRTAIASEAATPARRINIDAERIRNGLAQLVLALIKLLHELMERQAIARMDTGDLSELEIERLGSTLMKQNEEIDRLREVFGLSEDDLNLDLGPLGRLLR
jgi:hypothetical protein